jgi:hypothetical protein
MPACAFVGPSFAVLCERRSRQIWRGCAGRAATIGLSWLWWRMGEMARRQRSCCGRSVTLGRSSSGRQSVALECRLRLVGVYGKANRPVC